MSDRVVYSFADVVGGAVPLADATARHPVFESLSLLTAPVALPALSTRHGSALPYRQKRPDTIIYCSMGRPVCRQNSLGFGILQHRLSWSLRRTAHVSAVRNVARTLEEEYCIARIRMVLNRVRPQLIRHGMANNVDDAMDEAGLSLLGLIPEDEDLIACGNSGKSILSMKTALHASCNIARRLKASECRFR